MKKQVVGLVLTSALLATGAIAAFASNNTTLKQNTAPVVETEAKSSEKDGDPALNVVTKVTEAQAKQTALSSVNGEVKSVQLEDENGTVAYGFEISMGGKTYDVKVDANKNTLLKSDQDNEKSTGSESKTIDTDNINDQSENSQDTSN